MGLLHAVSYVYRNVIGQSGEYDDDSFHGDENSQGSSQNNMCVSGESVSLSCNNLSGKSIGSGKPGKPGTEGPQGPRGPQSISGSTYYASTVEDDTPDPGGSFLADSVCQVGDAVISGRSLYVSNTGTSANAQPLGSYLSGPVGEQTWRTFATPHSITNFSVQSTAYCFDNP